MALILALSRRFPEARDNQAKHVWRGMIGDPSRREDELGGKTLLVVGLWQIGDRFAQLAKAFDMRAVGLRRDPAAAVRMGCMPWASSNPCYPRPILSPSPVR